MSGAGAGVTFGKGGPLEAVALGENQDGSQPSATSAARATFFGPSAPRNTGISARNGWMVDLTVLPSPLPPEEGSVYWRPTFADLRRRDISAVRSEPNTRQNNTCHEGSAMVSKALSPQSRLS
jgi:hypothetical protein